MNFIFYVVLITFIKSQTCIKDGSIDNTNCFTDIKIFGNDNKYYRAGHFASNKNGDMVIEYSYLQYRLFFDLKNDGKYLYPEETKEIEIINSSIDPDIIRRYESVNCFVSLCNDTNKDKEYLMSLSSWKTLIELYDLENNEYSIYPTTLFFDFQYGTHSYVFQILEAKINDINTYFCIYILNVNSNLDEYHNFIQIKKFILTNFDEQIIEQKTITIDDNIAFIRITSSIICENYDVLIIFFMNRISSAYYAYIYNYELIKQNGFQYVGSITIPSNYNDGLFFKALYLQYNFGAFLYFGDLSYFIIQVFILTHDYTFDAKLTYGHSCDLDPTITLNEFLKIDVERLVFISTSNSRSQLNIILFDFFNWYEALKVRYYRFSIYNEKISTLEKELSASIFNGFLAITATTLPRDINTNQDNFFSIFLMFGYANGTDSEINIFPYLMDTNYYDESKNIINDLLETMKIENNIFGYEKVEQIKLTTIPEELLFYNGEQESPISNGSSIGINYRLNQNKNLIKSDGYYYLQYQFIVTDSNFSSMYTNNNLAYIVDSSGNPDISSYTPHLYYGRVNTLKFKLCNIYCKTCKEMGDSDTEQKCESCSDKYSYFNSKYPSICVNESYFYDSENNKIEQCTPENSKFYIDINTNKSICFKNSEDCPTGYEDYNTETKECRFYIPKTTVLAAEVDKTEFSSNPPKSEITKTEIMNNPQTIKETEISNNNLNINPKTTEIIKTEINKNPKATEVIKIQDTKINSDNKTNTETEKGIDWKEYLKNNSCSNLNCSNDEINKEIDNIIKNYEIGNESIVISGPDNSVFHLTTSDYEIKRFGGNFLNTNGLSIIDLGDCEDLLKAHYEINPNKSLIIKKYEQLGISAERNIQYEVYHPDTKKKLNLSVCDSGTVDIYIPVELNEKLLDLYEDLQKSGYDLFNIEDPFYNDLCSPYKSENGTDVLLSDRKNDYYNNNYTTCQANCQYSSFNSEYQFLKCECKVIVDDIDINDFDKFSKKIYKNFYDILKNSNYKTLKCYKLVFNLEYLKKNIGSFVVIVFFVGYICFFSIYLIKGITPLQEDAIKTICNKFKDADINILKMSLNNKKIDNNQNKNQKGIDFPPKKKKCTIIESDIQIEDKKQKKKKRKSKDHRKSKSTMGKRKSIKENDNQLDVGKDDMLTETKNNMLEQTHKEKLKKRKSKVKVYNEKDNINKLDDLDLNNLTYEKAVDLDKRTLSQIYWSKLKGKHLLVYTFFSCHDHNLVYIKIARFLFLVCTSMAMNVIFFFDSSMHKIYLDYGKYNIIQQIPQIIYSSIVSLVIEILIGFLSYTDKNIYQIRQLEEYDPVKIKKMIKAIKIKLIIFFAVTFIFFGFYWYLISSFCAVYTNTQKIYLKDFATSFSLGLVYPFAIQLCFSFLRIFALRDKNKKRSLIYKFC